jgi:TolB-like protein
MKHIPLFVLCLAFVCTAAAAQIKENLAVLPFSGGEPGEGETVAELFSYNDELNQVFNPIPRTSIARAVSNEQRFQTGAGMTDPDTIAAIGAQLGAAYVVAGNITRLGRQNLLIISILKIDELRQVSGDIQSYAQIEEIQSKLPAMARNIIAATRMSTEGTDKLAVVPLELGGNIDSQVADTLAQILSINLIRSGKYLVYPRTASLDQVQAEYTTQLSGVTADENMVDMGRGENPRFVLSVAARRLGSLNMFNASIINLETGVQLIGKSLNYNSLDDGIRVMENLTGELTGVYMTATDEGFRQLTPEERAAADRQAVEAERAAERAEAEAARQAERAEAAAARQAERQAARDARRARGPTPGMLFGYGVLNLAGGLGSFIQGDAGGGVFILLSYGGAAGLIVWELMLDYEDDKAGKLGPSGVALGSLGILYGFIRPGVYQQSRRLAQIIDGFQLVSLPGDRGQEAVRLSYTLRF